MRWPIVLLLPVAAHAFGVRRSGRAGIYGGGAGRWRARDGRIEPVLLDDGAFAQRRSATSLNAEAKKSKKRSRAAPEEPSGEPEKVPYYGPTVKEPDAIDFDLTGGRPGPIIEKEDELERKEEIMEEIRKGVRQYPDWMKEYGTNLADDESEFDINDEDAVDASTLGVYTIHDLRTKFEYEWDPETDPDPNVIEDTTGFVQEVEKDEDGIELGYDPLYGSSYPIDKRTMRGDMDSYMLDIETDDETLVPKQFHDGDLEAKYNEDIVTFRKSLDIIETRVDPFLPDDLPIPRHVAKWYGYPEQIDFPSKNYTNNRFTKPEDMTNFDAMTPARARERATELARAQNAEWLPDGISQEWHRAKRKVYDDHGTLVGSLEKGECDPELVELIQPALKILNNCVELLSIEQKTVFRFHYHGLMKNKFGMAAWTETLIRDCGVEVTGVVFETGFRRRDPAYDGGFSYNGPMH